ncbi:MAG TPA: hypothetical protein VE870_12430 [Bacteroidales bacterium]|nr:hypothetical protein [Bacteroidales bacterium]
MSLLKNYLTTLFRSFSRDLFYSVINLFGLATGLTAAFLIFIYIQDELSYDKYVSGPGFHYGCLAKLEGIQVKTGDLSKI